MKREKMLPCVFSDDVLCSFRKSERARVTSRCSGCGHYREFVEEIEREDEEFWNEVDERSKNIRCHCDKAPCSTGGACFGVTSDSCELWVCPRFDVNRFSDGSVIKQEFLRLRAGDWIE